MIPPFARLQEQYRHHIPFNLDSNQGPVPAYDALTLGSPAFDSNVVRWDMIRPQNVTEGDRAVLWDLVLLGDGGAFLDRIVTPVFRALAYEISSKGAKGVEPAMRITYDDANESFVLPQNITRILKDVGACAPPASLACPRPMHCRPSESTVCLVPLFHRGRLKGARVPGEQKHSTLSYPMSLLGISVVHLGPLHTALLRMWLSVAAAGCMPAHSCTAHCEGPSAAGASRRRLRSSRGCGTSAAQTPAGTPRRHSSTTRASTAAAAGS